MVDANVLTDLAIAMTGVVRSPAGTGTLYVVLEAAEHLPALVAGEHLNAASVVFAPAGSEQTDLGGARRVDYRGSLGQAGDQFWLDDDFVVEVQAYAVGRFLSIHGPMLLRVSGPEDLWALADDATLARDTGRLPRVAASPMVHLADMAAFGWPAPEFTARRLHVGADGAVSLSPAGVVLGQVRDLPRGDLSVLAASPSSLAVGAVVTPRELAQVHQQCPWLPRHLSVVSAVRSARALGVQFEEVSGFGSRLDSRIGLDDAGLDPARPVILFGTESAFVADPLSGRVVPLTLGPATALERHLDGSGDPLGSRIAHALAAKGFWLTNERAA